MHKTLKSKVLKDLSGISDTGFHQLWMQVQHKTLNSLLLCVSYKPPDCDISCFEDFRERYKQALAYGLPILVVGDLNSDLIVSSSKSKTLYNLCTSLNMKQLITQPTRLTETSKTLIDVIFTWNPAITVDSGIVETHISDHYLVFAVLNLRMLKPPAAYVVARSYKHYDPQSFLSDLNKIPWYENILSDNVNEKLLYCCGKIKLFHFCLCGRWHFWFCGRTVSKDYLVVLWNLKSLIRILCHFIKVSFHFLSYRLFSMYCTQHLVLFFHFYKDFFT